MNRVSVLERQKEHRSTLEVGESPVRLYIPGVNGYVGIKRLMTWTE